MSYLPANDRYDNKTNYRRCGISGLRLPEISLGLWHNFGGADVLENGRAMLRFAFDQGITHFDLANNYGPPPGSAEENFGVIFLTCILCFFIRNIFFFNSLPTILYSEVLQCVQN